MPHPKIDWPELGRSLQHDEKLSRDLLEVMGRERLSLERREYEQFEQLLGDKQRLLAALEQSAQARRRWLGERGFDSDGDALATAQAQAPEVARVWRDSAVLWRECQRANQINEQICQRTRVVVERMLDILRGEPGQSATYDARGVPRHQEGGRTITNA